MFENFSKYSPEGNLQNIEEKLFGPVSYTDGIVSLENLNPTLHGKPTPLDPESVYVIGTPTNGGLDYRGYAELEIMDRLGTATESLDMPNDLHLSVASELERRLEVMIERNQTSYGRLLRAIENDGHIDDAMLDIVSRARHSDASVGELGMLLNAYPDMISVEFYKFTNPFNNKSIAESLGCISQEIDSIDHTAELKTADHVTTRFEQPSFISEDINPATAEGINVRILKHKIGNIQFETNTIEIIRKLVSVEDRDGKLYLIGVSGYLRSSDYDARLEKLEQTIEKDKVDFEERNKKFGAKAIDMDMLSAAIQPQLEKNGITLDEYLARVRAILG